MSRLSALLVTAFGGVAALITILSLLRGDWLFALFFAVIGGGAGFLLAALARADRR